MRKALLLFILTSAFGMAFSQAGMWTWMKGDSAVNSLGSFGVQGIPSSTNEPPARYAPGFWTDTSGCFWVYGGVCYINSGYRFRCDLWKFDPNSLMWTWMNGTQPTNDTAVIAAPKGIFNPQNQVGRLGFGMFTWVTSDNHLWIYGGNTAAAQSTLWQYDPAINQWAWMGTFGDVNHGTLRVTSPTNSPGARYESNTCWTDTLNNLWLFGGYLVTSSTVASTNDVWKYERSTGWWTWMSGSNVPGNAGTYGTIGVPSTNNKPPSRLSNFFWNDKQGNFWLIGGTYAGNTSPFQDVWRFNPRTYAWTWKAGAQNVDMTKPTGNLCDTLSENIEGERYENRAVWKLCEDVMVNFGGHINDNTVLHEWNDIWAYEIPKDRWIKLGESDSAGSYGMKGVPSTSNFPPVRMGAVGFKDRNNNLWLFGGCRSGIRNYYNDLWKYRVDNSCLSIQCTECIGGSGGIVTALHDTVCPDQPPILHFSGIVQNVQWQYSTDGTNYTDLAGLTGEDCLDIPTQTSYYQVKSTDGDCPLVTVPIRIVVDTTCQITDISDPWPMTSAQILVFGDRLTVASGLVGSNMELYDANGRVVFQTTINHQQTTIYPGLSSGVYFIRINSRKVNVVKKWVRL